MTEQPHEREVYPVRCNCPGHGFEGCHGPMGYHVERCEEHEARWWMACLSSADGMTLWNNRFDSRAEAEAALDARQA